MISSCVGIFISCALFMKLAKKSYLSQTSKEILIFRCLSRLKGSKNTHPYFFIFHSKFVSFNVHEIQQFSHRMQRIPDEIETCCSITVEIIYNMWNHMEQDCSRNKKAFHAIFHVSTKREYSKNFSLFVRKKVVSGIQQLINSMKADVKLYENQTVYST